MVDWLLWTDKTCFDGTGTSTAVRKRNGLSRWTRAEDAITAEGGQRCWKGKWTSSSLMICLSIRRWCFRHADLDEEKIDWRRVMPRRWGWIWQSRRRHSEACVVASSPMPNSITASTKHMRCSSRKTQQCGLISRPIYSVLEALIADTLSLFCPFWSSRSLRLFALDLPVSW